MTPWPTISSLQSRPPGPTKKKNRVGHSPLDPDRRVQAVKINSQHNKRHFMTSVHLSTLTHTRSHGDEATPPRQAPLACFFFYRIRGFWPKISHRLTRQKSLGEGSVGHAASSQSLWKLRKLKVTSLCLPANGENQEENSVTPPRGDPKLPNKLWVLQDSALW